MSKPLAHGSTATDIIRQGMDDHRRTVVNGRPDETASVQVRKLLSHRDKLNRQLIEASRKARTGTSADRAGKNERCNALRDLIDKTEKRIRYLAGSCYSRTADYDKGKRLRLSGFRPDPDQVYSDAFWKGFRSVSEAK